MTHCQRPTIHKVIASGMRRKEKDTHSILRPVAQNHLGNKVSPKLFLEDFFKFRNVLPSFIVVFAPGLSRYN